MRIACHEDGKPRGFAHVEFGSAEEAKEAVKLTGVELDGRTVRLDVSAPRRGAGFGGRRGRGPRRGGRTGGFGGDKE